MYNPTSRTTDLTAHHTHTLPVIPYASPTLIPLCKEMIGLDCIIYVYFYKEGNLGGHCSGCFARPSYVTHKMILGRPSSLEGWWWTSAAVLAGASQPWPISWRGRIGVRSSEGGFILRVKQAGRIVPFRISPLRPGCIWSCRRRWLFW